MNKKIKLFFALSVGLIAFWPLTLCFFGSDVAFTIQFAAVCLMAIAGLIVFIIFAIKFIRFDKHIRASELSENT
jgi:hypothetical protein